MTDPMRMLDGQPADLANSIYDFDAMSIEKKKVFIEKSFAGERTIIDIMFSGTFADHFFNSVFEKIYREKRDDMIKGLKGKLTFDEFKSYFASLLT